MARPQTLEVHPARKEIARYLLSRGFDQPVTETETAHSAPANALADAGTAKKKAAFTFPVGLAPQPEPISPAPDPSRRLPRADVVVITWTVDELAGLAQVFTPGVSPAKWHRYSRLFQSKYSGHIRPGAPAALSKRLGSYMPVKVGNTSVLDRKSVV